MKLFIDIASFDQSVVNDCFSEMAALGHLTVPLWRIPATMGKPVHLHSPQHDGDQEATEFIDLNGLQPVLAAHLLNNFLFSRGAKVLLVGSASSEAEYLYSLIDEPSFKLLTWPSSTQLLVEECFVKQKMPSEPIGSNSKPTLAIVSPYPPQRTGVADYIAQLLPDLSAFYQLVLVLDDNLDLADFQHFPGECISAREFLEKTSLHDRVLYQMGNSPAHLYALPLLEIIPGVITLHDFYMGDALMYQEIIQGNKSAFLKELFYSHGFNVLPMLADGGLPACVRHYPCNLKVLRLADTLVAHSDYVVTLAKQVYGNIPDNSFKKILHPRALRNRVTPETKSVLRQKYGIGDADFVVATFGFAGPSKCHDVLIQAWIESSFATDVNAHLLLVGEYPSREYLEEMQKLCEGVTTNVRFVGYVNEDEYREYLDIIDLAVQLRINSRGETSGTIMHCLASGIPVIANNHGTVEEIPDDVLWKISDPPSVGQLLTAIEYLRSSPKTCEMLSLRAAEEIGVRYTLAEAANSYFHAIETSVSSSAKASERALIQQAKCSSLSAEQAAILSRAIVFSRQVFGRRKLFIDISEVVQHDLRTGIQRVVRSILAEFIQQPPGEFEICPIYLDRQQVYRHARQYLLMQYGIDCKEYADDPVDVRAGDTYLGIDLHPTATADAADIYKKWRAHGVNIIFVLYDLLPVQHPEWFPAIARPEFTRWLQTITKNGDQIIAISKTVADEMQTWLHQQEIPIKDRPAVTWFHLGADIRASLPTGGLPDDATEVLEAIGSNPSFLMVATVEPRKGHGQALAAFDALWARGVKANLVIVGKKGWMVDALADRILAHPELGKRLFWLQGISDEYLEAVYPRCIALLAASEGEGFGLPIIEAAQHQLPVIARDIPVFREVGGDGVSYFHADRAEQLALYLEAWLNTPLDKRPKIEKVSWQTWRESALQIDSCLR